MSPPRTSWRSIVFTDGWLRLSRPARREQRERSVRPLGVVVGEVAAEHVFEVAAAEDQ